MAAVTLLQLVEVAAATVVLVFGVLRHSDSLTLVGGGFLIGLAVINILASEGGTIYRRSLIGYGVGAVIVVGALIAGHFVG